MIPICDEVNTGMTHNIHESFYDSFEELSFSFRQIVVLIQEVFYSFSVWISFDYLLDLQITCDDL